MTPRKSPRYISPALLNAPNMRKVWLQTKLRQYANRAWHRWTETDGSKKDSGPDMQPIRHRDKQQVDMKTIAERVGGQRQGSIKRETEAGRQKKKRRAIE